MCMTARSDRSFRARRRDGLRHEEAMNEYYLVWDTLYVIQRYENHILDYWERAEAFYEALVGRVEF